MENRHEKVPKSIHGERPEDMTRFGDISVTLPPVHGKGHRWYFSGVEFVGESESVIRIEKYQVVEEFELKT